MTASPSPIPEVRLNVFDNFCDLPARLTQLPPDRSQSLAVEMPRKDVAFRRRKARQDCGDVAKHLDRHAALRRRDQIGDVVQRAWKALGGEAFGLCNLEGRVAADTGEPGLERVLPGSLRTIERRCGSPGPAPRGTLRLERELIAAIPGGAGKEFR